MFNKKKKFDLLEQTQVNLVKTQQNLDQTQQNIKKLLKEKETGMPMEVLLTKAPDLVIEKTQEEKVNAAYALNLCTVSVSQIVDYDDVRTLDQEYNTILNNLNLQNMPKDKEDALLDILKQLLNVITFFKLQEGDKEMLDKEYQYKMKNAIWSAVPNVSVILASPDPSVVLFNLATQVGTGYMHYRKVKSENKLENDKQQWQLKRAAYEQINGLRRELFDTAWRLSKEYNFDDSLRLSERQIEQYNQILIDAIPRRKYERLLSIKEFFRAFPPFWYYLGHAATEVEDNFVAIESFYEFLRLTGHKTANRQDVNESSNILREDHLCASCALELAALIIEDRQEFLKLLEIAIKESGGAPDVMQMCAMNYLGINDKQKAINILRYLVNEGYNVDVNASILGCLYFNRLIYERADVYGEYQKLKEREDSGKYMVDIPPIIPELPSERDIIITNYYNIQKKELAEHCNFVFVNFSRKIKNSFYDICRQSGNISNDFGNLLNDSTDLASSLLFEIFEGYNKDSFRKNIINNIKRTIESKSVKLDNFLDVSTQRTGDQTEKVYERIIVSTLLDEFEKQIKSIVNNVNEHKIFTVSYTLNSFCLKNNLPTFSKITNHVRQHNNIDDFLSVIYSQEDFKEMKNRETKKDVCLNIIKKYKDKLVKADGEKLEFILSGETNFGTYMKRHGNEMKEKKILDGNDEVIAILNDERRLYDMDLVFTTNCYFIYSYWITVKSTRDNKMLYTDEIKPGRKDDSFCVKDLVYENKNADIDNIRQMITEIAEAIRKI